VNPRRDFPDVTPYGDVAAHVRERAGVFYSKDLSAAIAPDREPLQDDVERGQK